MKQNIKKMKDDIRWLVRTAVERRIMIELNELNASAVGPGPYHEVHSKVLIGTYSQVQQPLKEALLNALSTNHF